MKTKKSTRRTNPARELSKYVGLIEPMDPAAPTSPSPIIDQEFGVTQDSYFTRFELLQYTPDKLISQKGFNIFEQMMTDDQISMAITGLKIMRLATGYEVVEASDDPLDIEIADYVADVFEKMEGGIRDALFNMMGAVEIGWSLNEKIWDFYQSGPYKGMVRLKSLKSKTPRWFNPAVDDFNNITSIVAISPPIYGRKLPRDKFVVYSFQKRYENVFGTSRLRCLYQWWWLKQVMLRALGVYMEKFGIPLPVGYYPTNMNKRQQDNFLKALQALRFEHAVVAPDGTKIDFKEVSGKGAAGFLETIEKADLQMVRVIMGQTMTSGMGMGKSGASGGGSGQSGSKGGQGMANTQMDVLNTYLDYLGQDLTEKPLADIIKELVDYNWSGVVKYPQLKFKDTSSEDMMPSVKAFTDAVAAGAVQMGPDDEEKIREILKFPSQTQKSALRPSKYKNKPAPHVIIPQHVVDPTKYPIANYRPPTPTGLGKPTNFAEGRRALTKYEERFDFDEASRILSDDGEKVLAPAIAVILKRAIEKLKPSFSKILDAKDTKAIANLVLPYRGELARALADGLNAVAIDALKQAKKEMRVRRASMKLDDAQNLEPQEVLDYIKDKSFSMAGDISDEVLKEIKQDLYTGVKTGKSYKDIVYEVENSLAKYVDLTQADAELSGPKLMTVVRTNVAEAYNEAKKTTYTDPALEGFVVAFQYSSILDDRTTEWCDSEEVGGMDGRIFGVNNPIWDEWTPPVWYNCRSVLIPITQADGWDGVESDFPEIEPPAGFN